MTPYFSSEDRVSALRDSFNLWLGTPFRDNWQAMGCGVDCARLAMALYEESGHLKPGLNPTYIVGAWKGLRSNSPAIEWIEKSKAFEQVTDGTRMVGDLLCFAQGRVAFHLGVYLDEGSDLFAHAISVDGACKRSLRDPTWSKRLIASYRPIEN